MGAWVVVFFFVGLFVMAVVGIWRREHRSTVALDPYTGAVRLAPRPSPVDWPIMRQYLACYGLYALLILLAGGAACVWWWFPVPALLERWVNSDWHPITRWVILYCIWVGLIVYTAAAEIHLRRGIERQQLLRRFASLSAGPGAFIGLGFLVWALVRNGAG